MTGIPPKLPILETTMELHPARVACDLQKQVVAELKRQMDQFPKGLVKIFTLLETLQSSQNECAETKATWVLQQAIALDTEESRRAVAQAEGDHIVAEIMRKHVTENIEFWVKRLRVSKADLKAYAEAQTVYEEANTKLCDLQSELDDIENELEDQDRDRRQQATKTIRLGDGPSVPTPRTQTLAHRFTRLKKR